MSSTRGEKESYARHPEFISGYNTWLANHIIHYITAPNRLHLLQILSDFYFSVSFKMQTSYTYILPNKTSTMLYIGVTSDIRKRITEHKNNHGSIFTKKYHLKFLIYFEEFTEIHQAIAREKQLKNWHKDWKWNLIKSENPDLKDLFEDF